MEAAKRNRYSAPATDESMSFALSALTPISSFHDSLLKLLSCSRKCFLLIEDSSKVNLPYKLLIVIKGLSCNAGGFRMQLGLVSIWSLPGFRLYQGANIGETLFCRLIA
jgi:hypothetical protein